MNSKVRVVAFVVVVALAVAAGVGVAMAGPAVLGVAQEPPKVPTLVELLALMASGVGVGGVIAFLFEKFEWFQNLTPKAKWWVVFGLSIGLPLGATLALSYVPADVWAKLEPYWRAIAVGFLVWLSTQVAHRLNVGHPL